MGEQQEQAGCLISAVGSLSVDGHLRPAGELHAIFTQAGIDLEKLVRGEYLVQGSGGGEGLTPGFWKTHSAYGPAPLAGLVPFARVAQGGPALPAPSAAATVVEVVACVRAVPTLSLSNRAQLSSALPRSDLAPASLFSRKHPVKC